VLIKYRKEKKEKKNKIVIQGNTSFVLLASVADPFKKKTMVRPRCHRSCGKAYTTVRRYVKEERRRGRQKKKKGNTGRRGGKKKKKRGKKKKKKKKKKKNRKKKKLNDSTDGTPLTLHMYVPKFPFC
jgi:hypothetical protein